MKIHYLLYALLGMILFTNCDQSISSDPLYPTIIKAKPIIEIDNTLAQLEKTPLSLCTSIDTFGFPIVTIKLDDCIDSKNWRFKTSSAALNAMMKNAIIEFGFFVNTTDSAAVTLSQITTTTGISFSQFTIQYPDSLPPVWKLVSKIQKYNNIEVRGTNLSFLFSPYGLVSLGGQWYNDIYIPETDNYSIDDAKLLINNKTLTYKNTELLISEKTIWKNHKKIIVPVRRSDTIELRACWALYPDNWEVLIDSNTGEIIATVNISKP